MSNLYIVWPEGNRWGGGAGCCFRSPCLDAEENITGSHPITPYNLVVSEQIQGAPILFQMVLSTWGKATQRKALLRAEERYWEAQRRNRIQKGDDGYLSCISNLVRTKCL